MDSDRIMVLEDGAIVEFDTPSNLLQKEDGLFKAFVEKEREGRRKSNSSTH